MTERRDLAKCLMEWGGRDLDDGFDAYAGSGRALVREDHPALFVYDDKRAQGGWSEKRAFGVTGRYYSVELKPFLRCVGLLKEMEDEARKSLGACAGKD